MLIWDIAAEFLGVLLISLLAGALFVRLKQGAMIGYMLVGMLLGPFGLGIMRGELAEMLSEFGVVFLLFVIGLEFSIKKLKAFGSIALLGGSLQVGITLLSIAIVLVGFHKTFSQAMTLGAAVALSSTAVVIRTLIDRFELDSAHGRASIAILLFQDIAVVALLLMLSSLGKESGIPDSFMDFLLAIVKAGGLIAGLYVVFNIIFPRLFAHAATRGSREHLVILAIISAGGSAYLAHALGLSPTLGAFLAGMMLGESPVASQMRADIISFEALFLTLFFTSIGMMADLGWIASNLVLTIGALVALIVIKGSIAGVIVYLFRHSLAVGIAAGACLANIGEFAFVISKSAFQAGILDEEIFKLMVAVSVLSMMLAPYLIALAGKLLRQKDLVRSYGVDVIEAGHKHSFKDHVLLVGFGPVGKKVLDALSNIGSDVVVIDLNPSLLSGLRLKAGLFLFGDARRQEILVEAGIETARALIITIPDTASSQLIVEQARHLNKKLSIVVRSRYSLHVEQLKEVGANIVVDEENAAGDQMAKELVKSMGFPESCVLGGEGCR